jgi:GNAT superfamily N-acetyltransferase
MLKRIAEKHFALVAEVNGNIVGIIQGKDNHVSLLFVTEEFQRRGIAGSLLKRSIDLCLENNPELMQITVCSSPNSIKIYEKLGFKQTDCEQSSKGLRFTPMMLKLSDFNCKD